MPDKWEYPWQAAWDFAFHAVYEHLLWIAGAMDHGGHHIDL
jgi:hypothetical protein